MPTGSAQQLSEILEAAESGSSAVGSWPKHLSEEQQDAWAVMVEVQSLLVGLARTRLAGGHVNPAQLREATRGLHEARSRAWPRRKSTAGSRSLGCFRPSALTSPAPRDRARRAG